MRRVAFLGLLSSLVGTGCIATTSLEHQRASVRNLKTLGLEQQETEGVVILVDPITTGNWREQPDVAMHMLFQESGTGTSPVAMGSTMAGAATATSTSQTVRDDTLALVPLPAFRVEVLNRSKQPVVLDPSKWTISDGQGSVAGILDNDAFRKEVERVVWQRHRNLYDLGQSEQLSALRQALTQVSLIGTGRTLGPGEQWQGFVSYDLYTDKPVTQLNLSFAGTRVGDQPDAPLKFAFATEKRPIRKCPVEGEVASVLGVCKSDIEGYDPASNGPCIQETRAYNNSLRTQLWIASSPVADSDLYRTLQSQDASRKLTNRGLKLRSAGWAVVGLGLIAAVVAVVAIIQKGPRLDAPIGLSGLAISTVGWGLAYKGQTLIRQGMQSYNELSETSGVCAPVW